MSKSDTASGEAPAAASAPHAGASSTLLATPELLGKSSSANSTTGVKDAATGWIDYSKAKDSTEKTKTKKNDVSSSAGSSTTGTGSPADETSTSELETTAVAVAATTNTENVNDTVTEQAQRKNDVVMNQEHGDVERRFCLKPLLNSYDYGQPATDESGLFYDYDNQKLDDRYRDDPRNYNHAKPLSQKEMREWYVSKWRAFTQCGYGDGVGVHYRDSDYPDEESVCGR